MQSTCLKSSWRNGYQEWPFHGYVWYWLDLNFDWQYIVDLHPNRNIEWVRPKLNQWCCPRHQQWRPKVSQDIEVGHEQLECSFYWPTGKDQSNRQNQPPCHPLNWPRFRLQKLPHWFLSGPFYRLKWISDLLLTEQSRFQKPKYHLKKNQLLKST